MSKDSTPRYGHKPIVMERCDGPFTKVGQFRFAMDAQRRRSIIIALPYDSDLTHFSVCAWTIDHKNHCDAQWSWDGNKAKPTLKPSLHWVGVWHGKVTDGKLVEA